MAPDALFTLPPAGPIGLVAFRWCNYDVPFWARPNSRPGRWHRVGDAATQYWSLHPDAAWAELIRHEGLTTEPELDMVRMPFWTCRIETGFIIDLRRTDARRDYEITDEALVDDDWTACQDLRARLDAVGARGVIAPSAALPEHANLTLFGARRAIAWSKQPALASTIPTAKVSLGRPPEGLVEAVVRSSGRSPQSSLF